MKSWDGGVLAILIFAHAFAANASAATARKNLTRAIQTNAPAPSTNAPAPSTHSRQCPQIPITDNWPEKLSQTQIYSDTSTAKISPDFLEYKINIPFWSSGAEKRKAVCIPGDQPIAMPQAGWIDLPDGAIVLKEFSIMLNTGHERLETRIIYRANGKWLLKTYRWQPDQRDASRVDLPETVTLNAPQQQKWEFMPSYRCEYCHYSEGRNRALGWTAAQLNSGDQLPSWIEKGLITQDTIVSDLPKYPPLADTTLSPYKKTKLYLDVNCANCHRPAGMNALMDLRYNTSLADMRIVDRTPSVWNFDLPDSKVIKPFAKEKSVLWLRLNSTNSTHMPPLGASLPDKQAIDFIGQWIDSGATEDQPAPVCNGNDNH